MNPVDAWAYTGGDKCADFFTLMLRTYAIDVPAKAHVFEIGSAEFDWLTNAHKSWPDMTLSGIDVRRRKNVPHGVWFHNSDVLTYEHPVDTLDWVVAVSTIEHVGLGHYGDPKDPDGDTKVLALAYKWLKPGGWLSFDVPWNAGKRAYEVVGTSHRVYDEDAVESRLVAGLPWRQAWTGCAHLKKTKELVVNPEPLKGGETFYYRGFHWQKPHGH